MNLERRTLWALVTPSTVDSVSYLASPLLSSAARRVKTHGRYLALVSIYIHQPDLPASVFPVCAIDDRESLPKQYIPIASACGPRLATQPRFAWRHGPCVVDTTRAFEVIPVFETALPGPDSPNALDSLSAQSVLYNLSDDMHTVRSSRRESKRIEMEEAGPRFAELDNEFSRWSAFGSFKSTKARPAPGDWGVPLAISARVSFDITEMEESPIPLRPFHEEFRDVERYDTGHVLENGPGPSKVSFFHLSLLAGLQALCGTLDSPLEQDVSDLTDPTLMELCASLPDPDPDPEPDPVPVPKIVSEPALKAAPQSAPEPDPEPDPERLSGETVGSEDYMALIAMEHSLLAQEEDDLVFTRMFGPAFTSRDFNHLPVVSPPDIQIVYVDLYGTLIDNETGIYNALLPVLDLCGQSLSRSKALTLYFDIEDDWKKRFPGLIYSEIMRKSYDDFRLRLGLDCSPGGAAKFLESFFDWPLFPDAVEALSQLVPGLLVLAGVADVDFETLFKCAAFQALHPYLTELLTWDAVRCYRPHKHLYDMIFRYYDTSRVPRACWTMISGSLFRDIESTRPFDVSGIWVKRPGTLARNFQEPDDGIPYAWAVCDDVLDAASCLLRHRRYAHSSKWLIAS
ncbi:unnamed protein product [Mycena citricolor]|uniref:Uncharacterized protein n=1 Tax=Mycena citricolor TaxID=2018698 RepID=A0AAD2Q3A9_9AGAR|nr:unnamed protein product [Mycena citricolor]